MAELDWKGPNTDATWAAVTSDADLREALLERTKPLTLLSATSMAQTAIREAAAVDGNPLQSSSQTGTAVAQQAPEIDPEGVASDATIGTARGLGAESIGLDVEGDTVALDWEETRADGVAAAQAEATGAHGLTSNSVTGAPSLQSAAESVPAGLTSNSLTGTPSLAAAAESVPLGQTSQTATGEVSANYFGEDFRITGKEGDTTTLAWGPTDKGQFA